MSISVLKNIFECSEIKANVNYSVGFEFLHKTTSYSIIMKSINNYLSFKK